MGLGGWFFALTYDRGLRKIEQAGLQAQRETLLARAGGDVLEIGGGTGANLRWYGATVRTLTITEPEGPMIQRLMKKAGEQAPQASVVRAPAEQLPFADDSFDTVVATLVLCTVADLPAALAEVQRVLRPTGRLLLIEHVRASDPTLARRQDRLNGLWRHVAAGCNCNRPTRDVLQKAGFGLTEVRDGVMNKAPGIIRPLITGTATL